MKKVIQFILAYFFKVAFWFRYRIKVKGIEKLTPEALPKKGGVLFLANHPTSFVDPTLVTMYAWPRFPIRPMIVEYMYYIPVINTIMRFLDALPIPNFSTSSNSLKRKKSEKAIDAVIEGLQAGENFQIAPAGTLKSTALESIGGASAVHKILQGAPDTNVVLVRTKGLWGSSFSKYYTGKTPPVFPTIFQGIKFALKNLLFFTPRREVIVEYLPAPADFPYGASRLELNRWLENWYNQPDGLTPQQGPLPGDSLVLVSYSMWAEKYLEPQVKRDTGDDALDIKKIPQDIQDKVIAKLTELTELKPEDIKFDMDLASDVGLDSLDIADLVAYLQDQFDVTGVPVNQLTTVGKLMALAARQVVCKEEKEEEKINVSGWNRHGPRKTLTLAEGKTIPEMFLNNCERFGNVPACGDARSGVLSYSQLKLRALLLAEYIRHLPGEYIGILLPASVAASVVILATEIAGKVPLMLNWTVGSRHLESVVKTSNVQVVLSSWTFLDKLENIELQPIETMLVMLEDVKNEISLIDKLKAYFRSKMSTQSLLRIFKIDRLLPSSKCVLLFTSGTESMPKGVPLSHENVISNLQACAKFMVLNSDDVIYGILPPFHAFGFSISCLFGLMTGMKVAFSADPTDGRRLANGFEKWGVTIMVGAPTFIKNMLKFTNAEQIKTMRVCVTGAEKAPPELIAMIEKLGKKESLVEGYGITECSPVLTANPLDQERIGVGKAVAGVSLCIVHPENYTPVQTGQQGLVLARGPNVFAGYLNHDVASPFIEFDGKQWYKTGDLGYFDINGNLTITGRMKRFIKVGGEMISLTAIEDALLRAGLRLGWPTSDEGPALAVCAKEIVGEKPKIFLFTKFETSTDQVNTCLKDSGFSNLVKVSSVIRLAEIPIMGSGKVHYRSLEGQYLTSEASV